MFFFTSSCPAVNTRLKVSNGQERETLQSLNFDYVSDEETGVGVNKGKWVVSGPIRRSERASVLMERLQQRINVSQREDLRPCVPRVERCSIREANAAAQCILDFSRHRACNRRRTLRGGGGGGLEE